MVVFRNFEETLKKDLENICLQEIERGRNKEVVRAEEQNILYKLENLSSLDSNNEDQFLEHKQIIHYIIENSIGKKRIDLIATYATLSSCYSKISELSVEEKYVMVEFIRTIEDYEYASYVPFFKEMFLKKIMELDMINRGKLTVELFKLVDEKVDMGLEISDIHEVKYLIREDEQLLEECEHLYLEYKSKSILKEDLSNLIPEMKLIYQYCINETLKIRAEIYNSITNGLSSDEQMPSAVVSNLVDQIVKNSYSKLKSISAFATLPIEQQEEKFRDLQFIAGADLDKRNLSLISSYLFLLENHNFLNLNINDKSFITNTLCEFNFDQSNIDILANKDIISKLREIKDRNEIENQISLIISLIDYNKSNNIISNVDFIIEKVFAEKKVEENKTQIQVVTMEMISDLEAKAINDASNDFLHVISPNFKGEQKQNFSKSILLFNNNPIKKGIYEKKYILEYENSLTTYCNGQTIKTAIDLAHSNQELDVNKIIVDFSKINAAILRDGDYKEIFTKSLTENYNKAVLELKAKKVINPITSEPSVNLLPHISEFGFNPYVGLSSNISSCKWITIEQALAEGIQSAWIFTNEKTLEGTEVSLIKQEKIR